MKVFTTIDTILGEFVNLQFRLFFHENGPFIFYDDHQIVSLIFRSCYFHISYTTMLSLILWFVHIIYQAGPYPSQLCF